MKRVKVMFASALDTIYGLGVSGLASCLLTTESLFVLTYNIAHLLAMLRKTHLFSALRCRPLVEHSFQCGMSHGDMRVVLHVAPIAICEGIWGVGLSHKRD